MVDFNSEGTIAKPPKEIVALIIIEKLYNFLEADEQYAKTNWQGASIGLAVSRARLRNLFLVCNKMLQRRCEKEEFEKVKLLCMGTEQDITADDLMSAFFIILTQLDNMKLIKLDTNPVFDRHRVEEANKQHGY